MHGFLVTFYTQESRTFEKMPLADWILKQAKEVGISGATMISGKAGYGHDGRFHSENYFDLEDRPMKIAMAAEGDSFVQLMERVKASGLRIFYTKAPVEFGFTAE